jgi:hypothetical protein
MLYLVFACLSTGGGCGTILPEYHYHSCYQTSAVLLTKPAFHSMIVSSADLAGGSGIKKTLKTGLTEAKACPKMAGTEGK